MTDTPSPSATIFIADLQFHHRAEGDNVVGEAQLTPHLLVPGTPYPRVSVVATLADVLLGVLVSHITAPRVALTTDLTAETFAVGEGDTLQMAARKLKVGSRLVVGECWFHMAGAEQPVAHSDLSFLASPRPQDNLVTPQLDREMTGGAMELSFPDQLGVRVPAAGVAELDRHPYVLQSAGTIQGGAMAVLAEVAAESLAKRRVARLQIRYLSAVREGPARAKAHHVSADTVRVEMHDAATGRLAAVASAGLAPLEG